MRETFEAVSLSEEVVRDTLVRDSELAGLDHRDFPVTVDILAHGIVTINQFRKEFPELISLTEELYDTMLGIAPEVGSVIRRPINKIEETTRKKVITFLEKAGYLVVDSVILEDGNLARSTVRSKLRELFKPQRHNYSLINLEAAQRVIQHSRDKGYDIFPRELSTSDPKALASFLKNNFQEWGTSKDDLARQRIGLLSGYPVHSVLNFKRATQALQKFDMEVRKAGIFTQPLFNEVNRPDWKEFIQILSKDERATAQMNEDSSLLSELDSTHHFWTLSAEDKVWADQLMAVKQKAHSYITTQF